MSIVVGLRSGVETKILHNGSSYSPILSSSRFSSRSFSNLEAQTVLSEGRGTAHSLSVEGLGGVGKDSKGCSSFPPPGLTLFLHTCPHLQAQV